MIHSACNADDRFRTPACAPRLIEEELTDHVIQLGAVPLDVSLEGRHLMGYRSDAAGRFGHGALSIAVRAEGAPPLGRIKRIPQNCACR